MLVGLKLEAFLTSALNPFLIIKPASCRMSSCAASSFKISAKPLKYFACTVPSELASKSTV